MTRKIILFSSSILMIVFSLKAQQVTITGNSPDYAGQALTFYSIDNYFCNNEVLLGECTVEDDGNFIAHFSVASTRHVHIRLGVFIARFIVEPEFSYEIMLPPRIDKSPEEEENPFFQHSQVYMNILSVKDNNLETVPLENELNVRVFLFDQLFNQYHDSLAIDAIMRVPGARLDSTISNFKNMMPQTDNIFFNNYALYQSGLLYFVAQRRGAPYISQTYFMDKEILYDNKAYMELFNATYERYFMIFGRANEEIFNIINRQGSFSGLKRLLSEDGALPNDTLRELVILKNIHDEFYANRFSRGALLHMLDSAIVHSKTERHSEIASEIRSKITRLLRGFDPPEFSLYKHDETLVSLHDYKGKYVYLMFCTTQNYVCLTQYELLKELHHVHHGWLDIVIISVDERFADMQYFKQESGYLWDFLHFANEPDILRNYDVRIFPTSFLIDPEGKLTLSPAPVPAPIYDPEAGILSLERVLWQELINKGLLPEYRRRGLINDSPQR